MLNTELGVRVAGETALVHVDGLPAGAWMQRIESHPDWPLLSRMPMRLSASIPVHQFRIANLLALKPGQLIESDWPSTQDVALHAGSVRFCWTEFEVVEQRIAVRLTRLA